MPKSSCCNRCCGRRQYVSDTRVVYANHGPRYLIPEEDQNAKFCRNAIISSRYTWYNFFPKNLFEQFHNLANVFFAMIAILFVFADPTTSIWANLGPLVAILGIIMIKDGVEDFMRHRRDRVLNHVPVDVLHLDFEQSKICWESRRAMNIRVGDVIRCDRGQAFPCDIVLLASSNASTEVNVTTSNLDGESNIKKYFAVSSTQTRYQRLVDEDWLMRQTDESFSQLAKDLLVKVECQSPCADLTKFEGRLGFPARESEKQVPLDFVNLVLRGAKLSNTDYVLGLVVYTGKETKLSLNGKQAKRKYSSREARSNIILLAFIIGMILLSIILAIVFTVWTTHTKDNMWYLSTLRQTPWEFVRSVFRFITVLSYLIPISIIFTVEFQQMYIAFTISSDLQMYDPVEDQSSKANSAQVADELGQVEFLFSDKTGTLTQNAMQLRNCALINPDGSVDLYAFTEVDQTDAGVTDSVAERESIFMSSSSEDEDDDESESTVDQEGLRLNARAPKRKYQKPILKPNGKLERILTLFTLCHTVEVADHQACESKRPTYEASSPDEKALVEGAADCGVLFVAAEPIEGQIQAKTYRIEYRYSPDSTSAQPAHAIAPGSVKQVGYIIDAVLAFDSTRKRMSVMARHPDGTCHIHSKGAETAMLEAQYCAPSCGALRTKAMRFVNEFAIGGLRTLVYGTREVDRTEYDKLLSDLHHTTGLVGEERIRGVQEVYQAIESNLVPCAVTGVEDKLQIGVKECLQSLRESGIQIWILTGDKEETAITVSQAAGHFTSKMSLIRLTHCPDFETAACWVFEQIEGIQMRSDQRRSRLSRTQSTLLPMRSSSFRQSITPTMEEVGEVVLASEEFQRDEGPGKAKNSQHRLRRLASRLMSFVNGEQLTRIRLPRRRHARRPGLAGEPIGLVIDGKTLNFVLHPSLRDAFLDLCMNVTTVLCCRMTPLQKASIVQLVQAGLSQSSSGGSNPVIAAVGDGGNDVAMLLQANIGVGIYGKEGREAARAGDYSLPGFRHLHRLFLLHGHWAYHRLTFTMNLFYFKCTALVFTEILLQFYSGFSQIVNYGGLMFALYNLTMTSLACLFFGMFEQHLPERDLLRRPYLYRVISRQANLRLWYVLLWIIEGIWYASITFYIATYALAGGLEYAPAIFYEPGLPPRAMYDFSLTGMANYIFLWIAVNVRIAILSRNMNYMVLIGFAVTTLNTGILFLYQVTAGYQSLEFMTLTKLARSPAFWFGLMLTLFTATISSLFWRLLSDTWWTGQIRLSEVPQRKIRRKKRRSPRFWVESVVQGHRDYGIGNEE